MARPKIPRKSTFIDMTAMCDVAFLLLSFFILTTKFKPDEPVEIEIPSSVSSKVAPEQNVVLVQVNKDGKVFLSMDDEEAKQSVLTNLNTTNNIGLSDAEIQALVKAPFYGVAMNQLKQLASFKKEDFKESAFPGIPVLDSANNQMDNWMHAIVTTYQGRKMNLLLKGDNRTKYPAFKGIINAFKANEVFKFQMVTNPQAVPEGTELWNRSKRGENID